MSFPLVADEHEAHQWALVGASLTGYTGEEYMGRKAGSKNKNVAEKVADIIADVAQLKVESPEQAAEVDEAIAELKDIVPAGVEGRNPVLVGKHPITGKPVYL